MNIIENFKLKLKEKGEVYFNVSVKPGAAQNQIRGELADDTLKIDIKAPARAGAANEELIRFLAKELAVPKSGIKIIAGKTSRHKLIKIS